MSVRAVGVRTGLVGFAVMAALALSACGSSGTTTTPAPTGGSPTATVTGDITVFAASSLTETFTQLGKDFHAANPGATVTFNFAGSSALATQINQGAPADVFASAAPANLKTVTDAGNTAGTPVNFAKNQLVIAVPKGNPKQITGLADLAKPGIKVALCAEQVPCGAAAKADIAATTVKITPVTLEQDVKAALSKVKLGEVDAALVYRTDAKADPADVDGIEFPESSTAINVYPIAALKGAANKTGAEAFIAWVLSAKGQAVLAAAGFQPA